jgi:hypothetical protein
VSIPVLLLCLFLPLVYLCVLISTSLLLSPSACLFSECDSLCVSVCCLLFCQYVFKSTSHYLLPLSVCLSNSLHVYVFVSVCCLFLCLFVFFARSIHLNRLVCFLFLFIYTLVHLCISVSSLYFCLYIFILIFGFSSSCLCFSVCVSLYLPIFSCMPLFLCL